MGINGKSIIVKFKNHRCGYGKIVDDYEVKGVPDYKTDDEHYIYVLCDHCDEFMDYENEWWVCPLCGARTRSQSAHSAAGRHTPTDMDIYDEFH